MIQYFDSRLGSTEDQVLFATKADKHNYSPPKMISEHRTIRLKKQVPLLLQKASVSIKPLSRLNIEYAHAVTCTPVGLNIDL